MSGRLHLTLFFVVASGLQIASQYVFQSWNEPRYDAVRYLNYAVNLYEHQVFGLSKPDDAGKPDAGRGNMPLYPALLAAVFRVDSTPTEELRCFLHQDGRVCENVFGAIRIAQGALAVATLFCIWLCGRAITGSYVGAWTSALAVVGSGQLGYYANSLLTENLSIFLCALLTWMLCKAGSRCTRWYIGVGPCVGLLVLTRPEFMYLAYAVGGLAIGWSLVARSNLSGRQALLIILAVALFVAPWLARNRIVFGDTSVTDAYAGVIFAQRVAYNRMGMDELACGFVYWFPDFGDTLAKRLFRSEAYEKLNFGPSSYANDGIALYGQLIATSGSDAAVLKTLITEEVLQHPFKHLFVTLLLAWRGVFVAKLWGVAGCMAFAYFVLRRLPGWRPLALASTPAWFMLIFYAAISVSIPRYSVCFIPVFSLALGALAARGIALLGDRTQAS